MKTFSFQKVSDLHIERNWTKLIQNPAWQTLILHLSVHHSGQVVVRRELPGIGMNLPLLHHRLSLTCPWFLIWLSPLLVSFLRRLSISLPSPASWRPHFTFDFLLTVSHCPLSVTFPSLQCFFWNLRGSLHDHIACILCAWETSTAWMSPMISTFQIIGWSPWVMAAETSRWL